jgi:hypothetical protein
MSDTVLFEKEEKIGELLIKHGKLTVDEWMGT